MLNCKIAGLTSRSVLFAAGSRLEADASVFCTGLIASPLTDQLPASKDDYGQLIADGFLRLSELPFVFAAGDAAKAQAAEGRFTMFSCEHSLQSAKFAGENAARDLLGLPSRLYRHERYVTCLDLGRSGVFSQVGTGKSA